MPFFFNDRRNYAGKRLATTEDIEDIFIDSPVVGEVLSEISGAATEAFEAATAAMTAAEAAQATADGSIRTYYQADVPWPNGTAGHETDAGDMWFDTDDGQAYRWNNTTLTWELIEDNSIAAALAAAQSAQTTADGKITAYYQPGAPATGEEGDLWFDIDDQNRPYFWDGAAWVEVRDGTIADAQAAADAADAAAVQAAADAAAAQAAADAAAAQAATKAQTFYQVDPPWADGTAGHEGDVGDIWFDTDDSNKQYVWAEDPTVPGTYKWTDANYLDPVVSETIGGLVSDVAANTEQIMDPTFGLSALLNQTQTTASDASKLAATADGRISISDFEPSTEERVDGSLWFARTRQRTNFITNPSFEVDAADWSHDASVTFLRELASVEVTGSYVLTITNNGVTQEHLAESLSYMPVEEEQIITGSIYAKLVSGAGTDNFVRLVFRDSGGLVLSSVDGVRDAVQNVLALESWVRISCTTTVPVGAVDAHLQVVSGSDATQASDVWRIDGGVLEKSDDVGRYFDGNTYDASWEGLEHLSISNMVGGKITDIFELDGSVWIEKFLAGSTLVDISATSITSGVLEGTLLADGSVPIDKIAGMPVVASEALAAGDLVNVYNDGGLSRVRKAEADNLRPCTGFVLEAVAVDEIASVYSSGYNPFQSGMTPGPQFLSVTPGGTSDLPNSAVGNLIQNVGTAIDDVVLSFNAADPIRIA